MPAVLTPRSVSAERDAGGGSFGDLPPESGKALRQRPSGGDRVVQRYKLGVWIGMGGIVMFFAALTSAMVVRQGLSNDWQPFSLPPVLYASTLVLLLSSVTVERARRAWQGPGDSLRRWINATATLGAVFVVLQLLGWQSLAERGIYLASNPANSFYYLLTAGHALHLLGGIAVMAYIWLRMRVSHPWPTRGAVVEATALYWHFLDGLWIYILGLLLIWR